ncbi:hypothetical protein SEVIR_8G189150v4 [Setaria viridis]
MASGDAAPPATADIVVVHPALPSMDLVPLTPVRRASLTHRNVSRAAAPAPSTGRLRGGQRRLEPVAISARLLLRLPAGFLSFDLPLTKASLPLIALLSCLHNRPCVRCFTYKEH